MKIVRAEPLRLYHFYAIQLGLFDRFFFKSERERPNFNRRMFNEDFARLFLSRTGSRPDLFLIASTDDELTQRLLKSIVTRYEPRSIDKIVREFVLEIARSLIHFGRAYYFLHDSLRHERFHIAPFSPNGVARLFRMYFQWVPKRTERSRGLEDKDVARHIRLLDTQKVMCFELPRAIRRVLSAQNKTLSVLDKHQFAMTDFQPRATHENPNPINHFDFSVWKDFHDQAFYRATQTSGWNGRKYDASKHSDFFDCYRLIRFRRNQLMLRDEILKQLSAELSRVGKGYNPEYAVEISVTNEVPQVRDLDELEAKLTREEIQFSEIINYCFS